MNLRSLELDRAMVQLGDGDDWLGGSALLSQANCEERACEAECYNKPFDEKRSTFR